MSKLTDQLFETRRKTVKRKPRILAESTNKMTVVVNWKREILNC